MRDRTRRREPQRDLPRFACLACRRNVEFAAAMRKLRSDGRHDCGGAIAQLAVDAPEKAGAR